jgi:hypothetical protein
VRQVQLFAIILWLLFVASSIMSGVTLWVSEHILRFYGLGVLVLLSPTFLGILLYRRGEFAWLLSTSIAGIIIQLFVISKLAAVDT